MKRYFCLRYIYLLLKTAQQQQKKHNSKITFKRFDLVFVTHFPVCNIGVGASESVTKRAYTRKALSAKYFHDQQ